MKPERRNLAANYILLLKQRTALDRGSHRSGSTTKDEQTNEMGNAINRVCDLELQNFGILLMNA